MAKKRIEGLEGLLKMLSNLKGKTYLMICELVDNSIASWLDDGGNETVKGLKVDVYTDLMNTNKVNHSIKVKDNAYGMNEEELENALKIGYIKSNSKSGLSIFGMGLKQAAFWLGTRLEIKTSKRDCSSYKAYIDVDEFDLDSNQDAMYDLVEFNSFVDIGTEVKISNINKGAVMNKNYYSDELPKILGWRYNKYLSQGLGINVHYRNAKSNWKTYPVKKFFPICENLKKWVETQEKDLDTVKEIISNKVKNQVKDGELKNRILKTISKDKDLMFCDTFEFEGIKTPIYYGILSYKHRFGNKYPSYKKSNGITIYQANRAVFCGPNTEEMQTFFRASSNAGGGEISQIRLFGVFDVSEFVKAEIISMDTNKQSLKWDDTEFKLQLERKLNNMKSNGLKVLAQIVAEYQNNKGDENRGPTKTTSGLNKIQKTIIEKFDKYSDIKVKLGDKEVTTRDGSKVRPLIIENIGNNDSYNKIELVEEQLDGAGFIYPQLKGSSLEIRININHSLWTPYMLDKSEEIKRNIIYPLAIMIGVAKLGFDSDCNEDKMFFEGLIYNGDVLKGKEDD